jgi:hypothetical protein
MSRVSGAAMLGSMMTYYRAWENRRFVRTLLREKQPEFADVLESAVREAPCLRCHGSRCSEADELTLSHPRRRTASSGRAPSAVRAARPARGRRQQPSRIQ